MIPFDPQPPGWVGGVELTLDPWHADAFRGYPGEYILGSPGPRKTVLGYLDYWGNLIATVDVPVECVGCVPVMVDCAAYWLPPEESG